MLVNLHGIQVVNDDLDLFKSITRSQAKSVHKDLPDGGEWRTIKGHHVYIKDGKVLAGSIPGVTKPKKATKEHLKAHQAHIDKEAKKNTKAKTPASKTKGAEKSEISKKPKKTVSGVSSSPKPKPASGSKPSTTAKPKATETGAKAPSKKEPKLVIDTKLKRQAKPAKPKEEQTSEETVEMFHGTKLARLDNILANGFDYIHKLQGSWDDFGNCAYFKSPAFDHKDHDDRQKWIADRQAKGLPVPSKYTDGRSKGNDTKEIVDFFTEKKAPAVVKALVPKKHLLDCTNGRPKELQDILEDFNDHYNEGTMEKMMGFVLKHLKGIDTSSWSPEQNYSTFNEQAEELKKLWGRDVKPMKVSPYEIFAKKNGYKAVVDKLDEFKEEGWQIGVYDPSIIQVKDHGKGIDYNEQGKLDLLKALLLKAIKALRKSNVGHTLLHHHIDDEGLHLYVGAIDDRDALEKSLGDVQAFMRGFTR
jgi:hypothetical protein